MTAQEFGGRSGEDRGSLSAEEVIALLQELVETSPFGTTVPLEWAVSACFLGDLSGLVCLTPRSLTEM
jgi:hypothetical protein